MIICRVSVESGQVAAQVFRVKQSVMSGKGDDFVAGSLDCAGLVNVDVPGVSSYDSFAWSQEELDDCGVSLRAADEEEHCCVREPECGTDELLCVFGVRIDAVAGSLLVVSGCEAVENAGMTAFLIVSLKANYGYSSP